MLLRLINSLNSDCCLLIIQFNDLMLQNLQSQFKLELCAFALKGEHNVYSLVPNIAVCIYIDQKWIYIKL